MSGETSRARSGGSIDRDRPLSFTWAGRRLSGYHGDTLASALLANGIRVVGRSFKYHRPRGIMAAGVEESNALVQLGTGARSTPNVRATEIGLYDGLEAKPVNCWPSATFDVGGINSRLSRFLPAGFYYKTFMWPNWHMYEGIIRRAAGLGHAAKEPDPDRYESRFAHCDVLVVGAGPAGLMAASAAARAGARVILAEQDFLPGGMLPANGDVIDGRPGAEWARETCADIASHEDATVLLRTTVVGYHDHNSLTLIEQVGDDGQCARDPRIPRSRTWLVRATKVILATGAIERPLVFSGNDRPGVMLASAARVYARRFGIVLGARPIILTNNDDAYRNVAAFAALGCTTQALIDTRRSVAPDLVELVRAAGVRHIVGGAVIDTRGRKSLRSVRVVDKGRSTWVACDHLSMSGGYNPTVHLFSQSGGRLRFDEGLLAYVPDQSVQAERSIGAARGAFSLHLALLDGHTAGAETSATSVDGSVPSQVPMCASQREESAAEACWQIGGGRGKAFVDFQNDVSVGDIELSARENFRSVEHLKRYTTLGMASDQGKTSNVNALAIMATLTGQSIEETGHTRYRFPFVPVALGNFAGRNRGEMFRPLRRLPADGWHAGAGAVFEEFGGWARPAYYPRPGETRGEAERREALAVRNGVGVFDASPLGKIEVKGPDAGRFLDLIYANTMSTLKPGKVRYGLMLNEQGIVIDDGVAVKLDADHFLVGTSSGGADRIGAWMEEWLQCEWLDLDVLVAPVSTAWGVVTLTGPRAKDLVRRIGTSVDLDAFPHMSFALGAVAGIPARIFRVSYTGETSYEINVPARSTRALLDAVSQSSGQEFELTPVGIDAWDLLRTEKGYLHIGADTDGTTTALDVGWGHILKKQNEFVGKRSLLREHDQRADRLNFVGFAVPPGAPPLPVGAHVLIETDGHRSSDGYVTSSFNSPILGEPVALGMLRAGRARTGDCVRLVQDEQYFNATVVEPTFYDKGGDRLRD